MAIVVAFLLIGKENRKMLKLSRFEDSATMRDFVNNQKVVIYSLTNFA
jgi:hypothetical protein